MVTRPLILSKTHCATKNTNKAPPNKMAAGSSMVLLVRDAAQRRAHTLLVDGGQDLTFIIVLVRCLWVPGRVRYNESLPKRKHMCTHRGQITSWLIYLTPGVHLSHIAHPRRTRADELQIKAEPRPNMYLYSSSMMTAHKRGCI